MSVVFADLVGSTALGEQLDPESLRTVMARYFDTVRGALERHGATVEKYIGDAVMAVFGVPVVREDDALRAVCAAAEMRDALVHLNDELEREHGVRLQMRTGINTGEVVVGGTDSAQDQRLATGDAVNVAARLQQAASPGDVYLGEQTHAAVRGVAVLQALPPLPAKGKREPLRAWRLVSVQRDAPAIARSTGTPFVGHLEERDRLRQAFDAALRERECRLVTIVGTPGAGKSRLTREFVQAIADEARVLVGRCLAYGQGMAHLPLADVMRTVAGDDPEPALARLLQDVERGRAAARLILGALGGAAEAGSPEETAWAFRRLFETLAASRPLVLVIDDIHWAEPALLDLLEYLVGFSSGVSILVVCLSRPDLLDTRPAWATPQPRTALWSLRPLSNDDAGRLIEGLRPDLPHGVRQRIVDTAEGNPLFVEQMLAMLADHPDAAADAVPPTIHALLAARLDRLPGDERAVLQRAAVQGRLFERGALAELLGPGAASGLGATLLALARKEFVRPGGLSVAGDDAFRFNHALIRDVAYASLTKESRAQLHAQLAAWLERHGAGPVVRDEIVGHHLEQACRYRLELGRNDEVTSALGRRAGELLAAAGRRALDRGEAAASASLLARAARLIEGHEPGHAGLLCALAAAHRLSGALDAAEQCAEQAITASRQARDGLNEQRAQIELAHTQSVRSRVASAHLRDVAERAIAVFEQHASEADLADAWQLMGMAELAAGDRRAQLRALQRGRAHAIASGDLRRQIHAWNEVGGSMLFGRTPVDEVLSFLDDELAWAREHGLAAVEADALLGGPYLRARLGHFDEARAQLERSKALWRELGLRYELSEAHSAGAHMALLAGAPAAAERELHAAIDIVAGMGSARYEALYRLRLAHVLVDQGRDDEARAELERLRERVGDLPGWKMAQARLLARDQRGERAIALAREAAQALAESDDLTARAGMLTHLAEVLHAAGDSAGAAQALAQAVALHEDKGNLLPAQRCREHLATMGAVSRP
ncbi:MAG: AAA family ATPase [Burkholderiales bacterium]|nr:AAA family ATPase [Burkholderiales bacterium]